MAIAEIKSRCIQEVFSKHIKAHKALFATVLLSLVWEHTYQTAKTKHVSLETKAEAWETIQECQDPIEKTKLIACYVWTYYIVGKKTCLEEVVRSYDHPDFGQVEAIKKRVTEKGFGIPDWIHGKILTPLDDMVKAVAPLATVIVGLDMWYMHTIHDSAKEETAKK